MARWKLCFHKMRLHMCRHTYKGIDGSGYGDLAAPLGLVLRDLLSADQHLPWPGKKSAGLMRKAELKFQPTSGTCYMLFLSQWQD